MSFSSGRGDGPPLPSATARGLSLAGLVLLVLFLTILAGALFPIALLCSIPPGSCGSVAP